MKPTGPHARQTKISELGEAVAGVDCEPARVAAALRLQELVERAGAGFVVAGRADPSPAGVTIWPPLSGGQCWRVAVSHGARPGDGNTLAEAVEAALEELGEETS